MWDTGGFFSVRRLEAHTALCRFPGNMAHGYCQSLLRRQRLILLPCCSGFSCQNEPNLTALSSIPQRSCCVLGLHPNSPFLLQIY